MTRTDIDVIASCVAILLAWFLLFGLVTAVEDCLGVEDEPVPLFIRSSR